MINTELEVPKEVQRLIKKYGNVFEEPKALPPIRSHDHYIPLILDSKPINIRPHKYSHEQKIEIERLVEEMSTSIIQPSHSPFASLAILVKKKDNTWRFCVDYRQLYFLSGKDKFPMPVIDELVEELGGLCYFSKLNLGAGYHQIRMNPSDISKTTFRTRHRYYAFKHMPFV